MFKKIDRLWVGLLVLALLWLLPGPAWAADDSVYALRDSARIYTVINTVEVANQSRRPIRNIRLEVPLSSNESVHWQDVLGEELSPQPERIERDADGRRTAHYYIEELAPGERLELVQRVAVQNWCVTYDITGNIAGLDSTLELVDMEKYLNPSADINSDAEEIISFAQSAAAASANPYLQARLLFSTVGNRLAYLDSVDDFAGVEPAGHSALAAFLRGYGSCVDYANLYAASLRAVGIPARVCGGYLYDPTARLDSSFYSKNGHLNADRLRHNWVEFYIKGVGWLVADPTIVWQRELDNLDTEPEPTMHLVDWTRFANISNNARLIYTCDYLPDNNSISYSYQGAAPLFTYSSELALYSVLSPFRDLDGHWAAGSVMSLYYSKPPLVNGVSANYFGVNENLTRAQLAALLNRVLDKAEQPTAEEKLQVGNRAYTDIGPEHWAYSEVYRAAGRGIISGYPDGTVRPDAYVTRAEAAVMLARVLGEGSPGGLGAAAYQDMQDYGWAAASVAELSRLGLMNGVAKDSFAPGKFMTRGEGAAVIDRWLQSDIYYEKYSK